MTRINVGPTARARRAKAQKDARYAKTVREKVAERDGYCKLSRYASVIGPCDGVSEWAHYGDQKRFKTRGLPPEERHTTQGSFMACTKHHHDYDRGVFGLHVLSHSGMNGDVAVLVTASL